MLTDYQLLAFKKLLSFYHFVVNIFGLLPFSFVQHNRHIKFSLPKAFYSISVLCLGMSSYWIVGSYHFRIRRNHFDSFILKLVTSVHGYSMLIIFFFVYIGPFINSRKIKIAYSKCKEIVDAMDEMFRHKRIGIWVYILDIIVKTVVIDALVAWLSYSFNFNSYNIFGTNIFLVLLLPPIAVRLHLNVFYGALIVVNVYFKQLNESLNDTITEAKISDSQKRSSEKCGDLSDEVDNIAILYFRLSDALKSINSIFSVNITLGHAITVITLTVQSLLLFVGLLEWFRRKNDLVVFYNSLGLIMTALWSYDLFTTAYAAERLVNEVCNTQSQIFGNFREIIPNY